MAYLSKALEATVRQIESTEREGNKAKLTATSIGDGCPGGETDGGSRRFCAAALQV